MRIPPRACFLAGLALASAGCGGQIPKTHYYVIQMPTLAPQSREPGPYTVAVMPFRVPDHLEQDRIPFRPSAVEVDYYEYHRWAERPAAALTTALVDRLRAQRLFSGVSVFDGRGRPDYLIRARVERLEEVDSPGSVSVRVDLTAEAVDLKTNRTVWSGSASHSGPVAEGDVRAVVAEMSRGVESCLGQLSTGLEAFAKSLPPAPVPASAGSR